MTRLGRDATHIDDGEVESPGLSSAAMIRLVAGYRRGTGNPPWPSLMRRHPIPTNRGSTSYAGAHGTDVDRPALAGQPHCESREFFAPLRLDSTP